MWSVVDRNVDMLRITTLTRHKDNLQTKVLRIALLGRLTYCLVLGYSVTFCHMFRLCSTVAACCERRMEKEAEGRLVTYLRYSRVDTTKNNQADLSIGHCYSSGWLV